MVARGKVPRMKSINNAPAITNSYGERGPLDRAATVLVLEGSNDDRHHLDHDRFDSYLRTSNSNPDPLLARSFANAKT